MGKAGTGETFAMNSTLETVNVPVDLLAAVRPLADIADNFAFDHPPSIVDPATVDLVVSEGTVLLTLADCNAARKIYEKYFRL
jgi:hypothetical protein